MAGALSYLIAELDWGIPMARKYLGAGHRLFLNGAVLRVGASSTVVDAQIDWDGTVDYCGNDENKKCNSIGVIIEDETWSYDVYIEVTTGKLWFDDEKAY